MSETYVPYSRADYAGDGEIDMFSVPFPFISREHVALIVNGRRGITAPRPLYRSPFFQWKP